MSSFGRPLVSVVIPTLNAGTNFARLLEALKGQRVSGDVEIVIVDSGSRDETLKIARAAGTQVLTIPHRQFNHGQARNYAIQVSKGEFVALTVQDALPTDDYWLEKLLAPLIEHKEIAGSYGLQVAYPNAGLLARARSALWAETHCSYVVKALETPDRFSELTPRQRLELIEFDNVTSCIKRKVWEEVPFPKRNYGEDMAWAKEVLMRGYRIAFVPTAQVWHCHERGWLYELRRAYIDGYTRVELTGEFSAALTSRDLLFALRRMLILFVTNKFDSMTEPQEIYNFLREEIDRCDKLASTRYYKYYKMYTNALKFAWALTNKALLMIPDAKFPAKAWIHLLRFAVVAVIGEGLGTTAATKLKRPLSERIVWRLVDSFLNRGV